MNHRRRSTSGRLLIPLSGIFIILSLIFLPGPNGLISVLLKLHRIRRLQTQIRQLEIRAESLEQEVQKWRDPDFATQRARLIFRAVPPDTVR